MTIMQLQILLAVVDKGSFTQAAEALNMTQSAVSHAIASLETELGVRLLQRNRYGNELNDFGREVVQHAREVIRQTEQIRQKAASIKGLARGRIRIGSFPSTSVRLLPGIIQQFQLNYPGIELVLLEGTDEEVYEWIENGVVDLGFVTLPVSGVETVLVARDEELIIMSGKNPLRKARQLTIRQIANDPFIMSTRYRDTTIQDLFKEAGIELNPKYKALGNATILGMIEENLGLTIFPEFVLPHKLNETGLVAIKLDPPVFRELAFGVRSLSAIAPAVKILIKTALVWSVQHGYLRADEIEFKD